MTRPLIISDCDEVLLHMVRHFGAWLGEAHDIDFAIGAGDFSFQIVFTGESARRHLREQGLQTIHVQRRQDEMGLARHQNFLRMVKSRL